MNKLAIDRDIVELLQIRKLTYFGQVSRFECSLRDIHTFFFMDISLEVDLKEDPGKSGLTISRRLFFSGDYTYRRYKICTGQKWRILVHSLGCQRAGTQSSSPRH